MVINQSRQRRLSAATANSAGQSVAGTLAAQGVCIFVTSSEYERVVASIAEEEGELLAAVAFWGSGAELVLRPHPGRRIKLICNLASGATNPSVIEALQNMKGVLLKQHDRLHAKVFVGSKSALVGSANFSSNGLNLEGSELSGWEEAGLLTSNPLQIDAIREWFSALWEDSSEIKNSDLAEARAKWAQRRVTRPKSSSPSSRGFTLKILNRSEITDRQVFVAIYGSWISEEAKKAYRTYEEQLTGQEMPRSVKLPPIYENWPELPKDAQVIDLYYGSRGALRCYGVFTRTHDVKFRYSDGSKGHLAVCRREDHIMGYPFGAKEAAKLAEDLRPYIEKIWNSDAATGDDDGKYIDLADVADIYG